jgi:hypothetical protein
MQVKVNQNLSAVGKTFISEKVLLNIYSMFRPFRRRKVFYTHLRFFCSFRLFSSVFAYVCILCRSFACYCNIPVLVIVVMLEI